jgi:hypothetical protein
MNAIKSAGTFVLGIAGLIAIIFLGIFFDKRNCVPIGESAAILIYSRGLWNFNLHNYFASTVDISGHPHCFCLGIFSSVIFIRS